jgi:hypothetical protein
MPITLNGDTGITTPMYNGSITANAVTPSVNMKNRIINGAMVLNQRGFSGSNSNNTYTLDRWVMQAGLDNKFTVAQSSTAPTGFSNSLLVTSSSAYSVPSGEYYTIVQKIEGFNTADLAFGTASAKTVTLSFQVYSSLTGTFGGALANSANNRSYPFTYTISTANTWTTASVTIAGDTSGTWIGATNGIGLNVIFGLGVGSTYSGTAGAWAGADYRSATGAVSVVGTNGATFYITGVQLEVGSTATSFDYRPYGTELALCQRYFQVSGSGASQIVGTAYYLTSTQVNAVITFQTTMRVAPTLIATSGTDYYGMARTNSADYFDSITLAGTGINACTVRNTTNAAGTAGDAGNFGTDNASAYIGWSAEL